MNRFSRLFKSRKLTRRIAVSLAFVGSLIVYLLTLEPDASYWDCPEYLVTAALLEVGHPPGNPLWTLTARIFSLFGGSNPQAIAVAVNLSSALFTALAVAILASVIFLLLYFVGFPRYRNRCRSNLIRGVCAWGGAMCFGWADSPWFSAVEAEVYAMSLFLTALVVRLMIGWALSPHGNKGRMQSRRHLLLIVYLTGLSIGVHQLNLLVIPALALIWLFRRRKGKAGGWRILVALAAGCGTVGIILLAMMPGVLKVAGKFELAAVNSLHLPPQSGVLIFWGVAMLICWLLPWCVPHKKGGLYERLGVLAWIPAMLLTGYSCYMLLLIRGMANPPMNEGAPASIFDLQSYLARDQYGSNPLFYGRTPKSFTLRRERIRQDGTPDYTLNALRDGAPRYALTDTGYIVYEHARIPIYAPELNMLFPRLTSADPSDIEAYADWAGMTSENMKEVEVSYALDSLGNPVGRLLPDGTRVKDKELRPTYLQQLRYLFGYQIGYMYFRYLLWNYSGRQNDRFSVGEVEHGNFLTGFSPVDDAMLGPQSKLPQEIGKDNPGHNVYFMIPLLLGILGIVMLQRSGQRGRRANLIILILFLMTGVAIVVYLNQSPREPRERDYSFLGSLWVYAIWIGCGMAMLFRCAFRLMKSSAKSGMPRKCFSRGVMVAAWIVALGLPVYMLAVNYNDHDRSGRTGVTDFATNLLESLEPDAILFTNGDNFTFPLWWAQEVAGVRDDVTIVNSAYLGTPWYIAQLRTEGRGAKGLLMQMPAEELRLGAYKFSRYASSPECLMLEDSLRAIDAKIALSDFYSAAAPDKRLPAVLRLRNPEGGDSLYVRTAAFASGSANIGLRQLAALDILSSNANADKPRPVYWMSAIGSSDFYGMRPFTSRTLHTRKLVYSDSLSAEQNSRLLDADLKYALSTLPGRRIISGKDGKKRLVRIYADDTFGSMITNQRQNLIRLGGRLLSAGRPADALRVALLIDSLFPPEIREYQIYAELDSAIYEGVDLARLYLEASRRLNVENYRSDSAYKKGIALLKRERVRHAEWKRYRESLPPRLQYVMTPKNMRKSRRLPYIDSLLNSY